MVIILNPRLSIYPTSFLVYLTCILIYHTIFRASLHGYVFGIASLPSETASGTFHLQRISECLRRAQFMLLCRLIVYQRIWGVTSMSRKTLTHNDNDNPKKSDVDTDIDLAYTQGCTAVGGGNTSPTTKMYEFYHLLPTVRIFLHCWMHGMT